MAVWLTASSPHRRTTLLSERVLRSSMLFLACTDALDVCAAGRVDGALQHHRDAVLAHVKRGHVVTT
jgi:hypothetical protein